MTYLKRLASASVVAALALFAALPANAAIILTMGQVSRGDTITGTNNGVGTTTITGTGIAVDITEIDAGLVTPLAAILDLNATSIAPATTLGGFVVQPFSGTFSITDGGSINYLSGSFSDAVFGAGSSLTLSVSDAAAGESVSFSSNVIAAADLGPPRGVSFSFADVFPPVGIHNGSLGSFNSSVSGTFSARGPLTETPEPGSLLLVALAMLGVVGVLRRRSL